MMLIELEQKYRYEAAELIKLFFSEDSYSFIDTSEFVSDALRLQCSAEAVSGRTEVKACLLNQQSILLEEAMLFDTKLSASDIKMPLKIAIYRVLSRYTGKKLPWGALTGIRPVKIVHTMLNQGKISPFIQKQLIDYYGVSYPKAALAIEIAENEAKYLKLQENSVSIYIGIPFCTSRCVYCSFPSVSTKQFGHLVDAYMHALETEVRWVALWLKQRNCVIDTVYIGGGTPTALSEHHLHLLLNLIVPLLPMEKVREYTIEAGRPDTINCEKLGMMKAAQVTRISINPQTMHNETLVRIGRNHTAEQVFEAMEAARKIGFTNINMDLIAGLPGESLQDFVNTLEEVQKLHPESITVHTMAVKRASRLHNERETMAAAPDEVVEGMIEQAEVYARKMNMKPYYMYRQKNILANLENVGYAKPGHEGIYNMLIMEEIQSILALGAGAISKIVFPNNRIERIFNVKNVEQYIQRIDEMIRRKADILESIE